MSVQVWNQRAGWGMCAPLRRCKVPDLIPCRAIHVDHNDGSSSALSTVTRRRALLTATGALVAAWAQPPASHAQAPSPAQTQVEVPFIRSDSGLLVQDIRPGQGAAPKAGDTVVVHFAGYTKGYQGKRIDNTSTRDEPYEFVLGKHQAIPAFEEAVGGMRVGGIRRVEVPGEIPSLAYPRDRSQRFTNELMPTKDGKIYRYRFGPQPAELGGQRALDFILDNTTLGDLNRTLLFDIKLLAIRPGPRA